MVAVVVVTVACGARRHGGAGCLDRLGYKINGRSTLKGMDSVWGKCKELGEFFLMPWSLHAVPNMCVCVCVTVCASMYVLIVIWSLERRQKMAPATACVELARRLRKSKPKSEHSSRLN